MVAMYYVVITAQLEFVLRLLSFAVEPTIRFPLMLSFINLSEDMRDLIKL